MMKATVPRKGKPGNTAVSLLLARHGDRPRWYLGYKLSITHTLTADSLRVDERPEAIGSVIECVPTGWTTCSPLSPGFQRIFTTKHGCVASPKRSKKL